MLAQDFIEEMKQKLEQEKQRLTGELKGLQEHTEVGASPDENATEVEMDNVSHDLIERISADLVKIEQASVRIAQGTYGIDDEGKEISEQRLRALPWADKAI